MSRATDAAAVLRASPALAGVVVTIHALSRTARTEYNEVAFDVIGAKTIVKPAISIYEGPEVAQGAWITHATVALRLACYGPTKEAAYTLARTTRAALITTQGTTVIGGRFYSAPTINQPVLDPEYPESQAWYALVEIPTAGDWSVIP